MAVPTPDTLTVYRPLSEDAYGNAESGWGGSLSSTAGKGFLVTEGLLMVPPDLDVRVGDRVRVRGRVVEVTGVRLARSPRRDVVQSVEVEAMPSTALPAEEGS